MTGFSNDWLELRGPADASARDRGLVQQLATQAAGRPQRIVDLGSGLGSTLTALAPVLGERQRWLLLDHDRALLDALPDYLDRWATRSGAEMTRGNGTLVLQGPQWSAQVDSAVCDLAADGWIDRLREATIVTGSALLDLVSQSWVERLIDAVSPAQSLWFPLNADGRISLTAADPADELTLGLFRQHHRRDKGFGPALGPEAATVAARLFEAAGRQAFVADSPWLLGSDDAALLTALLLGHAQAAIELAAADDRAEIVGWLQRRLQAVESGSLEALVGHRDLLVLPAAGR